MSRTLPNSPRRLRRGVEFGGEEGDTPMSPTREHFQTKASSNPSFGPNHHPFAIDVEFSENLTETQRAAFRTAVERWLRVVVAGGPPMTVAGQTIDGLRIVAKCEKLDREGGLSANTDLDLAALREDSAGPTAGLPAKATITLDTVDMKLLDDHEAAAGSSIEQAGIRRFRVDLVAHEIGHALGLSQVVWERKRLLDRTSDPDQPAFRGSAAERAFGRPFAERARPVPLETFGRNEEFIGHWRQAYFHSELMTFFLEDRPNLIGPVSVAALQDLGYMVDPSGAETKEIDLDGPAVPVSAPIDGVAPPTVLRSHRWLNCRVRSS